MAQIHAKLLQEVLDQNMIEKEFFVCHAVEYVRGGDSVAKTEILNKIRYLLQGVNTLGCWLELRHYDFYMSTYRNKHENQILLRRKWVEWMIQNHSIFGE